MKKVLFSVILLGVVFVFNACEKNTEAKSDCESKCETISKMCSEVITYDECKDDCNVCGIDVLNKINEEKDCDKIKESMSQCNSPKEKTNNCDAACKNYNNRCLTLVPNANQQLFDEGYESCMNECKSWATEKTECMVTAQDCPSMTEVCGL